MVEGDEGLYLYSSQITNAFVHHNFVFIVLAFHKCNIWANVRLHLLLLKSSGFK